MTQAGMLYEPKVDVKLDELQITRPSAITMAGERVRVKSWTFDGYSKGTFDYVDQPLHAMLNQFGRLLPAPHPKRTGTEAPPSEWIIAPFVSYQTLRKVCRIDIEWVETLGMHLEFDDARRTLKVFRFPSFCRLMYRYKKKGLLSQYVLPNHATNLMSITNLA